MCMCVHSHTHTKVKNQYKQVTFDSEINLLWRKKNRKLRKTEVTEHLANSKKTHLTYINLKKKRNTKTATITNVFVSVINTKLSHKSDRRKKHSLYTQQ